MRVCGLNAGRVVRGLLGGAVIAWCLTAVSAAWAQGTPEEQDACRPDVFRLCSSYIPNVDPIVACLKASEPQLSPACHQVMFPASAVTERPAPAKKAKRKTRKRSER